MDSVASLQSVSCVFLLCMIDNASDIHETRPHKGQIDVARRFRSLLHSDTYPSEISGEQLTLLYILVYVLWFHEFYTSPRVGFGICTGRGEGGVQYYKCVVVCDIALCAGAGNVWEWYPLPLFFLFRFLL